MSTGKAVKRELGRILENGDHPPLMRALDFVAERGHRKVTLPLEHNATITLTELVPGVVIEPAPLAREDAPG